jgi:hypothetical protein
MVDKNLSLYKLPLYDFKFLFCLCKVPQIKAESFLKKYFRLEASIALTSLIGSIGIAIWGCSFFSL